MVGPNVQRGFAASIEMAFDIRKVFALHFIADKPGSSRFRRLLRRDRMIIAHRSYTDILSISFSFPVIFRVVRARCQVFKDAKFTGYKSIKDSFAVSNNGRSVSRDLIANSLKFLEKNFISFLGKSNICAHPAQA